MVAKLPPGRLEKVKGCGSAILSEASLDGDKKPSVASKMLKSGVPPTLCKLRRLAEGLANSAWSKFIAPSLLFRGLTAVVRDPKLPLRRFSIRLTLALNVMLLLLLSAEILFEKSWKFSDDVRLGS